MISVANADIIAEYSAAISGHRGDIEALAIELSSDEYEITGIVTMEFDIAEDVLDLAPEALFFNYGNPMGPVCRAVRKMRSSNPRR